MNLIFRPNKILHICSLILKKLVGTKNVTVTNSTVTVNSFGPELCIIPRKYGGFLAPVNTETSVTSLNDTRPPSSSVNSDNLKFEGQCHSFGPPVSFPTQAAQNAWRSYYLHSLAPCSNGIPNSNLQSTTAASSSSTNPSSTSLNSSTQVNNSNTEVNTVTSTTNQNQSSTTTNSIKLNQCII